MPTQLHRVLGRQQAPAGLSWPGLGSGEMRGRKSGSTGQSGGWLSPPSPATGTQDLSAATGQGQGGDRGSRASPRSPSGAAVGTRFSCSVPKKPLQNSGGSERSRATTWAERDGGWGYWQCPGHSPHLRGSLTLHCRGVSSMMASGVGLAVLCPTSVGPNTRDRLRTSILQSGLCDTLQGATGRCEQAAPTKGTLILSPASPLWDMELGQGSESWDMGTDPSVPG